MTKDCTKSAEVSDVEVFKVRISRKVINGYKGTLTAACTVY
jgi:hypothetical protein